VTDAAVYERIKMLAKGIFTAIGLRFRVTSPNGVGRHVVGFLTSTANSGCEVDWIVKSIGCEGGPTAIES
jgi:hypothetical protein